MFSVPTLAVTSSKYFHIVMGPSEYVVWVLSCHSHTEMPVINFLLSLQFPDKNHHLQVWYCNHPFDRL